MRPTFDSVDAVPYVQWWEETYGPEPRLARHRFFQGGRRMVWVAAAVELEGLEAVDGVGMPFVRIDSRYWKPTGVAAVEFGLGAVRNVVELQARELEAFLDRRDVRFDDSDERRSLPWRGYVIARHRGVPVGVGEWHGDRLVSCVPKGKRMRNLDWNDSGGSRCDG